MPVWGDGSSPLTRGAPGFSTPPVCRVGLIPAYAGSTRQQLSLHRQGWAHPRLRGEHTRAESQSAADTGSSPLTRGARPGLNSLIDGFRLIPAYAGSTGGVGGVEYEERAHPRLRGEHIGPRRSCGARGGSSPLTRGARGSQYELANQPGLIPAYAGSTCGSSFTTLHAGAHPRLRGEHLRGVLFFPCCLGSSPLTRGAPSSSWGATSARGLIPAYAGSTSPHLLRLRKFGAHPRLRGEHLVPRTCRWRRRGSSPLTRGAPERAARVSCIRGLIPAYAGSTLAKQE